MSGFDANPFADPFATSPFSDPAVTRVTNQTNAVQPGLDDYNPFADQQQAQQNKTSSGTLPQYNTPQMKPESSQPAVMQPISEPPPAYSPTAAQPLISAELQRKEEELRRKEAELQAKEEALRAGTFDARANNWPPLPQSFCLGPCFYQDIAVDIPLEFQKLVKTMYYLWIYYACVMFLNLLGALALLVSGADSVTLFGFALLAFLLFTPLSFVCWFRPLYKAFRSDSSFNFMVFFFIFFFQFALSVIYAIGVPSFGSCGFIVAMQAISVSPASGTLAMLIAVLHCIFAGASFFMLLKIHRIYRGTEHSFAKAQEEFTTGVLRNPHVQNAAASAVSGAARQAMNQSFSGNRY
ncbi:secretory carrier-associated membrane protein 1-like isoform X2 [Argiope bruennichi]|uniref:Secretory carrier-associated membrane protein n=1 Tax=Argiope bruennichi TaxID=94029 RepID=A0A8T0E4S6_ARGBR|nr:secretory carrier-associated membrane protein 1-like isoform X2 [Argiope bruennichi]KAF8764244.1 Secretory carrier-associated membrane protein like [Argiope bruennichi]